MPGAKVEERDGKTIVTMSQSWLGTYLQCGEQARRDLREPVDGTNEQHLIGTTLHAYAAARLQGEDVAMAKSLAFDVFYETWPDVKHVRMLKPETAHGYATKAIALWEEEQFPQLDPMLVEYQMEAIIASWDGVEVWLSGTPDEVEQDGDINDWKTSSQWFDALAYERWDIQSSAYTWLCKQLGFEPSGWFHFWVYHKTEGFSQTVTVYRAEPHWAWLKEQCVQAAEQIIDGPPRKWHLNDQSYLCSEKWCAYWSDCKGTLGGFPTEPATLDVGGESTEHQDIQENT